MLADLSLMEPEQRASFERNASHHMATRCVIFLTYLSTLSILHETCVILHYDSIPMPVNYV
jgi:hypothetical protein